MVLTVGAVGQEAAKASAPKPADVAFQGIYKADEAWRRALRGGVSQADEDRRLPPEHLEQVDAATQAKALAHWESVLAERGRRARRVHLPADVDAGLAKLKAALVDAVKPGG